MCLFGYVWRQLYGVGICVGFFPAVMCVVLLWLNCGDYSLTICLPISIKLEQHIMMGFLNNKITDGLIALSPFPVL